MHKPLNSLNASSNLKLKISRLETAHSTAAKKRETDLMKTIILPGTRWTIHEVVEALLLDYESIRNYVIRYKSGGLKALLNDNHKEYSGELSKSETGQLDIHLDGNTYQRIQDITLFFLSTMLISNSQ